MTVFDYPGWEKTLRPGDIVRIEDKDYGFGKKPLCVYNYSLKMFIPGVGWQQEDIRLRWIEIPDSKLIRLIL